MSLLSRKGFRPSSMSSESTSTPRASAGLRVGDPVVGRRRLLPFDLLLTLGHASVRLFSAGPFDEFQFFQRTGAAQTAVEYLTCLTPKFSGSESYKPFGVFRFHSVHAQALPELSRARELWRALRAYGISKVPAARALARRQGFGSFDPTTATEEGRNRIQATIRSGVFLRPGQRDISYVELLDILRTTLSGPEKIAWIEGAFRHSLAHGEVVQRYYLDRELRAYVVRHHWEEGKALYQAEPSGGHQARGLLIYGASPQSV